MGGALSKSRRSQKGPEVHHNIAYAVRPAVREDIPAILWMIQLLAEHDGYSNVRKITEEDLLRDGFGDEKYFHCQVAELEADQPTTAADQPTTAADQPTTAADQPTTAADHPVVAATEGTALGASNGSHDRGQALPSVDADSSGSRLVGFVFYYYGYCTWDGRVAFIEDLFVKSQFRKKGIGLALLRACAQAAVAKQCVKLHLDVDEDNRDAIKWYKKLDFEEVDEELLDFSLSGASLTSLVAGGRTSD